MTHPRRRRAHRVSPLRALVDGLRLGQGGFLSHAAIDQLPEKLRESRDPKWRSRRAGLTAALEARRAAQEAAAHASAEERHAASDARIADFEDDVARLTLVTMTMMEMLVRKGIATREELSALVAEIDELDGEPDGKLDPSALRPAPENVEPADGA